MKPLTEAQYSTALPLVLDKARKMFKSRDFVGMSPGDLKQKFWQRIVREAGRYDPAVGRWEPFVLCVIESEAASLLRAIYAEKRTPLREACSLDEEVKDEDGSVVSRHEVTPEVAYLPDESWERETDVAGVISRLPEHLRVVAIAMGLGTVNASAEALDMPRTAVERALVEMRPYFEDAGLKGYL